MHSVVYKEEQAHDESVWCCAWKQSVEDRQNHIVTGGVDDLVKLWSWDENTLHLRHTLENHALGVVSVDIDHLGTIAASSSMDSRICIWDLKEGLVIKNIDAGPVDSWGIKFSPDSRLLATGSHQGKINLFGVESGKIESSLESKKFPYSVAFSPDGKYLASGAIDGIIKVFDIATGKLVHTLEGHAMPIRSLTFSKDSTSLITGSDDCHIKMYNVHHANLIGTLSGHRSWVLSVDCSPDNVHFASSSSDKSVKIWDIKKKECVHTFTEHKDQVWCVRYNHNGSRIVSTSDDKSVVIYAAAA